MATLLESEIRTGSERIDEKIGAIETTQWISFEFFPPKTEEGIDALFKHISILNKYSPVFLDVTWGAGGSTSEVTLDLCKTLISQGYSVNMHLTCTNMEPSKIQKALQSCKECGIRNILALRGDPPAGQSVWIAEENGFRCALDLVKYIRDQYDYGDFCITVAGYPEGHPTKISAFTSLEEMTDTEKARHSFEFSDNGDISYFTCSDIDYKKEITYLKEKVDAGANCIITQMFFDTELYVAFVKACRAASITVAIIPGIMCVSSYSGFKKMIKFCKSRVPENIYNKLEELKDDDEAVKRYGVELGVSMCRRLLEAGAPGLHFYTLNSSITTCAIIDELKLLL